MIDTEEFDVCLIYEHYGEFQGSNIRPWVEKLIRSMPTTNFSVVAIYSGQEAHSESTAEPEQLMDYHCLNIDIRKAWELPQSSRMSRKEKALPAATELLKALHQGQSSKIADSMEKLQHQLDAAPAGTHAAFLHSEPNWMMIRESYNQNAAGTPFQEYFHLSRALLSPLYAFSELVDSLPVAECYHTLTNGYAGYLGTLLQTRHSARLISSNKGSQTLPKRDFSQQANRTDAAMHSIEHVDLWLRLREAMKRVTNSRATAITTTSQHQMDLRKKELDKETAIHLIPDGIDTDHFFHLYAHHGNGPPPIVATIGPVVPARDIKGFIRAIASLREQMPLITGWVVGSLQSDPHYAKECKSLVRNLGLYNHLRFFGDQDESTIYPRIGALVVNTLTDSPPISLQHAQAAGVPVIATNIGACRELIEGRESNDKLLGPSGAVVPIADPSATAKAIANLLKDPHVWTKTRIAGVERCNRYYSLDAMLQQYRTLYQIPAQVI